MQALSSSRLIPGQRCWPLLRAERRCVRAQASSRPPRGPLEEAQAQFSRFMKQARSQVDSDPGAAKSSARVQPLTDQQNQIRKEESLLVNLWSSENFPKLGGLLTVIILFLVILSGPP